MEISRIFIVVMLVTISFVGCGQNQAPVIEPVIEAPASEPVVEQPWLDSFAVEKCTQATVGKNPYFILEPGFQLVLASSSEQVAITVLDETININGIETRIVEEKEYEDGKLKEVSRNYFTICAEHNDVFYHGEDVDDYKDGKVVGHGGVWRAGVNGARAGLLMPGKPEIGFRHYQEIADGVAMDRAEIIALNLTFECPAGEFNQCLKVEESSPLEPGDICLKIYAPGVGLVADDDMALIEYGSNRKSPSKPVAVPASISNAVSEVEINIEEMPAPVAEVLKKLYPDGAIREAKRETRSGGKELYAIEVFIGEQQYDVEVAPDGTVISNEKE